MLIARSRPAPRGVADGSAGAWRYRVLARDAECYRGSTGRSPGGVFRELETATRLGSRDGAKGPPGAREVAQSLSHPWPGGRGSPPVRSGHLGRGLRESMAPSAMFVAGGPRPRSPGSKVVVEETRRARSPAPTAKSPPSRIRSCAL